MALYESQLLALIDKAKETNCPRSPAEILDMRDVLRQDYLERSPSISQAALHFSTEWHLCREILPNHIEEFFRGKNHPIFADIERVNGQLKEKSEKIIELNELIVQLGNTIKLQSSDNETLRQDLASLPELKHELSQRTEEVEAKDSIIDKNTKTLKDLEDRIALKDKEISAKSETIASQGRALNTKSNEIRRLQNHVKNLGGAEFSLHSQHLQISNLGKQINDLKTDLKDAKHDVERVRAQNNTLRAENKTLRTEKRNLSNTATEKQTEVDALTSQLRGLGYEPAICQQATAPKIPPVPKPTTISDLPRVPQKDLGLKKRSREQNREQSLEDMISEESTKALEKSAKRVRFQ